MEKDYTDEINEYYKLNHIEIKLIFRKYFLEGFLKKVSHTKQLS